MGSLSGTITPSTFANPKLHAHQISGECDKEVFTIFKYENIGRLAMKLARFTHFGEDVLAQSSISGGAGKHPVNPKVLINGDDTFVESTISKRVTYRV